jgi:trans-aconitate methyltransferase
MKNKTTWTDPISINYHMKQWVEPKESTKLFEKFIKFKLIPNITIIDLGCGAGAPTSYLAANNPNVNFIGIDYSEKLIKVALKLSKNLDNLSFKKGDIFNLPKISEVEGVLLLQTISWIDGFEKPLQEIFKKISPKWIAITGLFYEGDISCRTEVTEFKKKSRKVFYNTYSIPAVQRYCEKYKYKIEIFDPFEMPIDLIKSSNIDILGTYTEKINTDQAGLTRRLQISGPILLNWYTLVLVKETFSAN